MPTEPLVVPTLPPEVEDEDVPLPVLEATPVVPELDVLEVLATLWLPLDELAGPLDALVATPDVLPPWEDVAAV